MPARAREKKHRSTRSLSTGPRALLFFLCLCSSLSLPPTLSLSLSLALRFPLPPLFAQLGLSVAFSRSLPSSTSSPAREPLSLSAPPSPPTLPTPSLPSTTLQCASAHTLSALCLGGSRHRASTQRRYTTTSRIQRRGNTRRSTACARSRSRSRSPFRSLARSFARVSSVEWCRSCVSSSLHGNTYRSRDSEVCGKIRSRRDCREFWFDLWRDRAHSDQPNRCFVAVGSSIDLGTRERPVPSERTVSSAGLANRTLRRTPVEGIRKRSTVRSRVCRALRYGEQQCHSGRWSRGYADSTQCASE